MKKYKRKYAVTLIEMIIVMILIATITGALAYNYRGALDEGRAFRTKHTIERLEDILNLHVYNHPEDVSNLSQDWKTIVSQSALGSRGKDSKDLLYDGWGQLYQVTTVQEDGETMVRVSSKAFEQYQKKRGKK